MSVLSKRWIKSHQWMLLLMGIVALLVISPIAEVYDRYDNVISPLTAMLLLAVTVGAAERRVTIMLLTALTFLWLVISVTTDGSGLFAGQSFVAPVLFIVLLAAIFGLLVRWMMRVSRIDSEVMCAAVCGYLILGILWTGLYAAELSRDPKALISTLEPRVVMSDLLYFSYTTLTTTGFGDIIPKNPVVRMFAVMEAIVGIFYTTIVIARFVGLYGLKIRPDRDL